MTSSFVYLITRFGYRTGAFLKHWYVGSARLIAHRTVRLLEDLDKSFALRVTLQHFFQPLYQDHSFIGHTLGFIFRSVRVVVASVLYSIIIIIALGIYGAWAGSLAYAFFRAFFYFPQ